MQKQSGNYIAMGHSLFIPEDKDRSNIFMHGHFCLRIENIFDDDNEVTNIVMLEMNQKKNCHGKASYLFSHRSVM